MIQHFKKAIYFSLMLLAVAACKKEEDSDPKEEVKEKEEYAYIRLLVSDESVNTLSFITPHHADVQNFEAKYPKSALYSSESGRFAGVVHRADNLTQIFDIGFESHGSHIDVEKPAAWATIEATGLMPTHFKSKGDEIILFNDGDGSMSVGKESDFNATAAFNTIPSSSEKHHGAMTKFNNGSYAVTYKDGSLEGTTLPERVHIINSSGTELFESTIQTTGIHGNAGDGMHAVFGSASGILVVKSTGEQRLIAHPESFGTAWFGSILEAKAVQKFIGYTAAKGAYEINLNNDQVTPIFQSDDIMQCKVNYKGNKLVILTHSGELRVYNLLSNVLEKSGSILSTIAKDETQKPQLVASSDFAYVTQPKTGEVIVVSLEDMKISDRYKVGNTPYRITLLGMEVSETGSHRQAVVTN